MAHARFGHTWWGEKWLAALTNVDFDNRLPRGKRYARNGSVLRLTIDETSVRADVQGSRRQPYKVSISLDRFCARDQAAVLDAVVQNPVVLSQLLAGALPPMLFESFREKHIPLFPETWSDMSASCSCPDWADCCKHIAAVIFLIANEVDKNPFLLFEMHGLEIFAVLEQHGYSAQRHSTIAIPRATELVLKHPPPPAPALSREKRDQLMARFDFSRIPLSRDLLLSLLTSRPLFYPYNDFKTLLEKALRSFAHQAAKTVRQWEWRDQDAPAFISRVNIAVNADLELSGLEVTSGAVCHGADTDEGYLRVFRLLFDIPLKQVHSHAHQAVVLSLMIRFALKLIEQSAVQFEILRVTKGHRIRWVPALASTRVKAIFDGLCELTTEDLFTSPCLPRPEQVKSVLSAMLGRLISQYAASTPEFCKDDISAMFFAGEILKTSRAFDTRRNPEVIALWLSRFQISDKDKVPVIRIDEADDGFTLDVEVEDRKADTAAPVPLTRILTLKKYAKARFGILKDLVLLAEFFPEIADYLASEGKTPLSFSPAEFEAVLFRYLPVLKLLRIPVLLPKGLDKLIRPRIGATVSSQPSADTGKAHLSLDAMLQFRWQVAIGDTLVSAAEFAKLVRGMSGIVKIKGQFVYIDDREIEKLMRDLSSERRLGVNETLRAVFSEQHDGATVQLEPPARKLIASILRSGSLPVPKSLKADLRAYQKRGYEWLVRNAKLGFGSLIADDMGLGKTVQVISFLLSLHEDGRLADRPALVIVPTTLLTNWQREVDRFAPTLRLHVYHGGGRKLQTDVSDVILTTYSLARRDAELLRKHKWPVLVLDEAQNIKNHGNAQTKAIKGLKSDLRIAMTGTPIENRMSDYWSIFDFLNKGYLKGAKAFRTEFAIPVETERNSDKLELFRKITAPFVLRRLKTDKSIISDLPDKVEIDQFCQLTREQAALYQSAMEETMAAIGQSDGIERRGLVLKLIITLKQICNHPAHFLKRRAAAPEASGKAALLMELISTMYDNEEKVLIFTQFTEMGKLLQGLIEQTYSVTPLFLHGGVTRKRRDVMVDSFQNEPHTRFLLLSLKAGGTGLNLTAARNVVHYDLWWNPAVEAQATDRAYRIGQTDNVMVHRLITRGTFEEKIDSMIKDKKELANLAVTAGEKWIGEYGNDELREMFALQ